MNNRIILLICGLFLIGMFACQEENQQADNSSSEVPVQATAETSSGELKLDDGGSTSSDYALDPSSGPEKPVSRLPLFQEKAEKMPKTTVSFKEEIFDFGSVVEGTPVKHRFMFKNIGKKSFQITRVKPACGCTTPEYSDAPVAPGEEGFIDVTFDTFDKPGDHTKVITVTGNFENQINRLLKLKGVVQKKGTPTDSTTEEVEVAPEQVEEGL